MTFKHISYLLAGLVFAMAGLALGYRTWAWPAYPMAVATLALAAYLLMTIMAGELLFRCLSMLKLYHTAALFSAVTLIWGAAGLISNSMLFVLHMLEPGCTTLAYAYPYTDLSVTGVSLFVLARSQNTLRKLRATLSEATPIG